MYASGLTDDHALLPGQYLNASVIPPLAAQSYIATQAPMPHTFKSFYAHVVASGANTIVNLTPLVERGMRKSDPYWLPADLGDGWSVALENESTYNGGIPDMTTRTLLISSPEHSHRVTQLHFEGWPDHGVIEPDVLLNIVRLVGQTRGTRTNPVWVHCSAGIGRSGTLIGALLAAEYDDRSASPLDMAATLTSHMRKQRAGMVQTPGQFAALANAISALRKIPL